MNTLYVSIRVKSYIHIFGTRLLMICKVITSPADKSLESKIGDTIWAARHLYEFLLAILF